MLNRKNPNEFRVTKNHSIEYYKHPYYKITINKYLKNESKTPLDEFKKDEIRNNIIKSYFEL